MPVRDGTLSTLSSTSFLMRYAFFKESKLSELRWRPEQGTSAVNLVCCSYIHSARAEGSSIVDEPGEG